MRHGKYTMYPKEAEVQKFLSSSKEGGKEIKKGYMRMFKYCTACITALFILGMSFAVSSSKDLAKVDGVVVTDSDLIKRLEVLPESSRAAMDKEKLLNKIIDEELLLREAQKLNLHEREDYKNSVEAYKRDLLVDLYLKQYLKENNTEEKQKKYYEENKEKYASPEMVRISVIKVDTEAEAEEIFKKVESGEDFAELARKYSKDSTARKGGDFGFRAQRGLRKDFADVAFSMKKGEIKGPVKAADGNFLIKLTDHKEAGIAGFEVVKNRIASIYANKLLDERISELRKAVKIQIDAAELKNLTIK